MMTKNTTEMIFPVESDQQFHKIDSEPVKPVLIPAESQLLTNESTMSGISITSVLKKRKPGTSSVDSNQPTACLMDIINDPKLAVSSTKSRKIRKITGEIEAPVTVTGAGVKKLVLKDGKIEIEEATSGVGMKEIKAEVPKRVTSASFRGTSQVEKWSEEETSKFYEGLEIFGSDFSMIGILFPKRTRDQIKKKFSREEKSDGKRVNEALKANVLRRNFPEKLMETLKITAVSALGTTIRGTCAVVDEINEIVTNIVKSKAI